MHPIIAAAHFFAGMFGAGQTWNEQIEQEIATVQINHEYYRATVILYEVRQRRAIWLPAATIDRRACITCTPPIPVGVGDAPLVTHDTRADNTTRALIALIRHVYAIRSPKQ